MSINSESNAAWYARVNDYSFSFWAIVAFGFLFVFGFQWAGIYLPAYLSGDPNGVQIDRYLVTLERPDVISTPQAMILSAIGYMYTASYVTIFLLGLLFSLIITLDYEDICTTSELEDAEIDLSCKSDLFDVLDADMSGELEFEEMKLMKLMKPSISWDKM